MRNFILLFATLLIVASISETVMRVRANHERARIRTTLDATELCTTAAADRRLIYTYVPGRCGTNSQGYFDVEHTFAKPEGVFRLVIIGDSVAQGRDVDPSKTFGRVLEDSLNARGDGHRYEVIILARIGYSTSQELVLLESEAFRYDPDVIVWSYCLNDPADPIRHNVNGSLGRYYYRPRLYLATLVGNAWFRVERKLKGRGCPKEFHAFLHCAYADQIRRNLDTIHRLASGHGVPVLFVIHPVFQPVHSFDDYSLTGVHRWLREAARRAGLVPLDVLDAFDGRDPDELKIHRSDYYDPWHLNVEGHRVTAAAIYDTLAAGSWLDGGKQATGSGP